MASAGDQCDHIATCKFVLGRFYLFAQDSYPPFMEGCRTAIDNSGYLLFHGLVSSFLSLGSILVVA